MSQTWEAMKADSKEARGCGDGGGRALLTDHVSVLTFISGPFSQNNSGERLMQGLNKDGSLGGVRGEGRLFNFFYFF